MSQLQIMTNNFGNFNLNVLAFSSPMSSVINGVQTKQNKRWYPVKAGQPDLQLDVQFVSEKDYETFQDFVRSSQKWALNVASSAPMVYLNWPERNINNWSGIIKEFQSGGQRANPAPRARFSVELVDSFVSEYTDQGSIGAIYRASYGFVMQTFTHVLANPFGLRLPAIPAQQQQTAQDQYTATNPNSTPRVTGPR
jgi:hypothetical protein